jgi:hypothetical protein
MLDMRGGYRNLVNNQLLEQIRRAFLRLLNHPHCAVVDRPAKRREGPSLDARPAGQKHDGRQPFPAVPPGTAAITETSHCENPDCVNAQAIAVAVPMISMTAPVREKAAQLEINPRLVGNQP